jgi:hypothetical protein
VNLNSAERKKGKDEEKEGMRGREAKKKTKRKHSHGCHEQMWAVRLVGSEHCYWITHTSRTYQNVFPLRLLHCDVSL